MTTFIILLILVIIWVIYKFFTQRDKMLSEINASGGLEKKYADLIWYLKGECSGKIVKSTNEYIVIRGINGYKNGPIEYYIFPSFTTVHIHIKVQYPAFPEISIKCEYPSDLEQVVIYSKIVEEVMNISELKTGGLY